MVLRFPKTIELVDTPRHSGAWTYSLQRTAGDTRDSQEAPLNPADRGMMSCIWQQKLHVILGSDDFNRRDFKGFGYLFLFSYKTFLKGDGFIANWKKSAICFAFFFSFMLLLSCNPLTKVTSVVAMRNPIPTPWDEGKRIPRHISR